MYQEKAWSGPKECVHHHCDPKPKAADAMPEDASMQEREDKLTVPHLTSERNAEQGSDRKVAQRKRIDPRSVRLLQVIAIVALELLLHPV